VPLDKRVDEFLPGHGAVTGDDETGHTVGVFYREPGGLKSAGLAYDFNGLITCWLQGQNAATQGEYKARPGEAFCLIQGQFRRC